jgi:molybdopterin converting factor small subunit
MQTTAVFYGRLRDRAGAPEKSVSLSEPISLETFRARLADEDSDLGEMLGQSFVIVAVNDVIKPRHASVTIAPGDVVAFMPPFSGG